MITDLDESLKQFLIRAVPLDQTEVDVAFELPDREWAAGLARPTVNLYLYDLRENLELRDYSWRPEPSPPRAVRFQRLPARIDLSYLVTAWTASVEDEHQVLWRVLAALLRESQLPATTLHGALAGLEAEVPISAGQPDGVLRNTGDFWSAIDNSLKPSINVVVTLPLDPNLSFTAPLVLTKRLSVRHGAALLSELTQIAGTVRRNPDEMAAAGVTVRLTDLGDVQTTDDAGRFSFPRVPHGRYTLQVNDGPRQHVRQIAVPGNDYDINIDDNPATANKDA